MKLVVLLDIAKVPHKVPHNNTSGFRAQTIQPIFDIVQ